MSNSMWAKAGLRSGVPASAANNNPGGGLTGFTNWAQQPFDWQSFQSGLQGFGGDAFQTILDTASGANLHGNPYLDATYQDAASNVTEAFNNSALPNIAAQFGAAGRTGGGLHHGAVGQAAGELTDSLSQMANSMYGANYANERANQLGAASGLMDLYNTGSSEALQRLGLAGNLFNNQQDNATSLRMNTNNNATQNRIADQANELARYQGDQRDAFNRWSTQLGAGLDAAGLASNLYGMDLGMQQSAMGQLGGLLGMADASNMQQIQNMLAAGGLTEGYEQRGIDEQMARWNYPYESQWDNLGRMAQILGPAIMESSSTSTGQTQQRGGSSFGNILGGLGTIAGFMAGGPAGAQAGGAIGGALGGGGGW